MAVVATLGVMANLGAASASAAGRGELAQLPSPMDCIEQHGSRQPECGNETGHGLTGASALVASPDGHNVYVIGGGLFNGSFARGNAVGQLAEFQRNPDGSVTQLPAPNDCLPPSVTDCTTPVPGFGHNPRGIAISPDGKNVYVTEQRNNALIAFTRDPATGALTPLGCATEINQGVTGCSNSAFGLTGPEQVVVSPDGRNVYVASFSSGAVAEFTRSPIDGSLIQLPGANACIAENGTGYNGAECAGNASATGLSSPQSLAISPDGHNLYVGNRNGSGSIAVLTRNPVDGSLTQVAPPNDCVGGAGSECGTQTGVGIADAIALVVSPDARNLYVASLQGDVAEFSRNLTTGAISQLAAPNDCFAQSGRGLCGTATGQGLQSPTSMAISPDGTNLYVGRGSYSAGGAIATLVRNPADGTLSQLPAPNDCLEEHGGSTCGITTATGLYNFVGGVVVSPDGANLYSAAYIASEGNFGGVLAAFSRSGPPATITVREASTPASDPGRFDLKVNTTVVRAAAGNGDSGGTPAQPGTYTVSETASSGSLSNYTTTITCTKNGNPDVSSSSTSVNVTVAFNDSEDCTFHNTLKGRPQSSFPPLNKKHPVFGQSILLTPIGGQVWVKLPGRPPHRWFRLTEPTLVPLGTEVNVRYGEVQVTSATDTQGHTQSAIFTGGVFFVTQKVGAAATLASWPGPAGPAALTTPSQVTVLTLAGPISCRNPSEEAHDARRSSSRSLWGSGHGSFRTVGKVSAATVRGTVWLTVDECDATVTRVFRGVVAVRDFAHHRTVFVSAGHAYRAVLR